jgi:hypothetical protein
METWMAATRGRVIPRGARRHAAQPQFAKTCVVLATDVIPLAWQFLTLPDAADSPTTAHAK